MAPAREGVVVVVAETRRGRGTIRVYVRAHHADAQQRNGTKT